MSEGYADYAANRLLAAADLAQSSAEGALFISDAVANISDSVNAVGTAYAQSYQELLSHLASATGAAATLFAALTETLRVDAAALRSGGG